MLPVAAPGTEQERALRPAVEAALRLPPRSWPMLTDQPYRLGLGARVVPAAWHRAIFLPTEGGAHETRVSPPFEITVLQSRFETLGPRRLRRGNAMQVTVTGPGCDTGVMAACPGEAGLRWAR